MESEFSNGRSRNMKTFKQFKEGKVTGINDGGMKDAQNAANKDMKNTKYDPTEGKRRGKGLLDRLLKGV